MSQSAPPVTSGTMAPVPEENTISGEVTSENKLSAAAFTPTSTVSTEMKIKRHIGIFGCLSFMLGTIIGAGIFVSPGGVLLHARNIWISMIIWSLAGLVSLTGGFVLIELSEVIPLSGGVYTYILAAYGNISAFLTAWAFLMLIRPSVLGVLALTASLYVLEPIAKFMDRETSDANIKLATKLLAVFLLLLIAFVNSVSVRLATVIQITCTFAKLTGLGIIIASGIVNYSLGHNKNLDEGFSFKNSTENAGKWANALYLGLLAYDGWDQLNMVTEEINNPLRNLPLAICISMPLITVIYMMANLAFLTRVDLAEFTDMSIPVATVYAERTLGVMSFLMPLSVFMSCLGSANGLLFATSRMTLVAARYGHLPDVVSFVSVPEGAPTPAIFVMVSITIVMVLLLDVLGLIYFLSYVEWIAYGGVAITHIVFRCKRSKAHRPFKTPIIVSLVMVAASIFLTIATVAFDPKIEYLYSVLFTAAGVFLYFPFVYFEICFPGMDGFTKFFQLTFRVSPAAIDETALAILSETQKATPIPSLSRLMIQPHVSNVPTTKLNGPIKRLSHFE